MVEKANSIESRLKRQAPGHFNSLSIQKLTSTTFPRSDWWFKGAEFSQATVPRNSGMGPSSARAAFAADTTGLCECKIKVITTPIIKVRTKPRRIQIKDHKERFMAEIPH
jgi:hypothetical protein